MSAKPLYQVFEELEKIKSKAKRVEYLRENSSKTLKVILDYAFNPKIHWLLPSGKPPYRENREQIDENYLTNEVYKTEFLRRMPIFTNLTPYPDMKASKREMLFIDLLETIHPKDADILLQSMSKKFDDKKLNAALVKEAWPNGFTKNWE